MDGFSRSLVFTVYNQLRADDTVDLGSLRRALGYVQRKTIAPQKLIEYRTTLHKCRCRSQYRPCKHILTRRLQIGGRDYLLLKFWAKTYGPTTLLEPGPDLFMRVTEVVDGPVLVATSQHKNYRLSRLPNLETFEWVIDPNNGYKHVYTALADTKNGRGGGWYGKYELAFVKSNPQKGV